jgi:hypothetical protein
LVLLVSTNAFAAITATNLTTAGANSPGVNEPTASITPTANKLVLACVVTKVASGTPAAPTLTGNGLNWVQLETLDNGVTRQTMFRAMGLAPTAGTVLIDFAGDTPSSASWSIFEVGNVDPGGTDGSIASVHSSANSCTTCNAVSTTLAAFFGVENGTVGCGSIDSNTGLTVGTGFTQVGQNSGVNTRVMSEYKTTNDTGVDAGASATGTMVMLGLEVCHASGPISGDESQILAFFKRLMLPLFAWAATCPEYDPNPTELRVFPGAEGFGTTTRAGWGGKIYRVTDLGQSGAGTLQDCVSKNEKRVCLFEKSGKINLAGMTITNPDISIIGQTAPSPGVGLQGTLTIKTHDVLLQHVQLRANDTNAGALSIGAPSYNVVIDHVSMSWGSDTLASIFEFNANPKATSDLHDVTISNSIMAEGLEDSVHDEGSGPEKHSAGLMIGASPDKVKSPTNITIIKNLLAHNVQYRNPLASGSGTIANNLIYNYGGQAISLRNTRTDDPSFFNIVGNKVVKGSNWNGGNPLILILSQLTVGASKFYIYDNRAEGFSTYGSQPENPWTFVENGSTFSDASLKSLTAINWPAGYTALPGTNTEAYVMANVGSRPKNANTRNATDKRILLEVSGRTGVAKDCVTTSSTNVCNAGDNQVSWESMAANQVTLDVPADDKGDSDGDGYTNLEEWIHDFYTTAVEP